MAKKKNTSDIPAPSAPKLYTTLGKSASAEYTEKKSVFIGYASPVKTEREALDFINAVRKKHSDARHNVFAYQLNGGGIARYSDDGEPQGTAGVPLLEGYKEERRGRLRHRRDEVFRRHSPRSERACQGLFHCREERS